MRSLSASFFLSKRERVVFYKPAIWLVSRAGSILSSGLLTVCGILTVACSVAGYILSLVANFHNYIVLSDERLGAKLRVAENRCVLFNSLTYVNFLPYIYGQIYISFVFPTFISWHLLSFLPRYLSKNVISGSFYLPENVSSLWVIFYEVLLKTVCHN